VEADNRGLGHGAGQASIPVVPFTPLEPPPTALVRGDSELIFPMEVNTLLEDATVEEEYEDEVRKAQEAVEKLKLGSPDPTDG
jgi:hypothetical protein